MIEKEGVAMATDLQRVVDLLEAMTAPANNSFAFQGGWDACRAQAKSIIADWMSKPSMAAKKKPTLSDGLD